MIYNDPAIYNLTIKKQIDKANFSYGDPTFTFKVSDGKGSVYYRTVRFTDVKQVGYDTGKGLSVTIENLPAGTYTVEELGTIRYELDGTAKSQNVTIKNADVFVQFKNKLTKPDNFSDTDVVANEYTYGENGWTVAKNKLSGTDKAIDTSKIKPNEQ